MADQAESSHQDAAQERRSRRSRRWLLWGAVVLLVLVVRALLPVALERAIERVGGDLVGRSLAVGNVDLEVLAGRVLIRDLEVGPPRSGEPARRSTDSRPVVAIAETQFDLDLLRLLMLELSVRRVGLRSPRLRISADADGWPTPLVLPENRPEWIRPWIERLEPWIRRVRWPIRVRELVIAGGEAEVASEHGLLRGAVRVHSASVTVTEAVFEAGRLEIEEVDVGAAVVGVDVIRLGAEEAPPPPPYPSAELFREVLTVDGHRLGSLSARDIQVQARRGEHAVALETEARLSEVRFEAGHRVGVQAGITLGDGSVRLDGEVTPTVPACSGAVRWEAIDLAPLLAFADLGLPVSLDRGGSSGDMRMRVSVDVENAALAFEVSGAAELNEIDVEGQTGTFGAHVHVARIDANRLSGALALDPVELGPLEADLRLLKVERPEVRMDVPVLRIARIDIAEWVPADLKTLLATARMTIASLQLSDGSVDANDSTVEPAMHLQLSDLDLLMKRLRWPELDADRVRISAREAGGGAIDLVGSLEGAVGQLTGVVSTGRSPRPSSGSPF